MKIAVASEGNKISGHFGHCEGFILFEVENNSIKEKTFIQNPGHKPGFLPVFLKEKQTNVIISGGMGETAQQLFQNQGIEVVVGAQGMAEEVVKSYVVGKLKSTGSVCADHAYEGHCND